METRYTYIVTDTKLLMQSDTVELSELRTYLDLDFFSFSTLPPYTLELYSTEYCIIFYYDLHISQ